MVVLKETLANLVNIFVSPSEAFQNLKANPTAWLPLLVLFVSWVFFWNYYYSAVDYPWLVDRLIEQKTYDVSGEEREQVVKGIKALKPGALIIISSISVLLILTVLILITSVYLVIVSAVVDDSYRFKNWFAFASWTSMPSLLAILCMLVNFSLTSNQQIGPDQLNPLSLNNLVFNVDAHNKFKTLLDGLDLTILWSWGLMIWGYHLWTKKSLTTSTIIILIPSALVYGIWLLVAIVN